MTSEIATALARRWQAAPRRISCVSRGGNLVYRFEAGTDRFYLRVIKPEVRPLELVAGAVDWQRHLHQRNAPVAEPLASADGHVLEVVSEDGLRRLATRSPRVWRSSTARKAASASCSTGRSPHAGSIAHWLLAGSNQSTRAMFSSVERTTSPTVISSGRRASRNPPPRPRTVST